MEMPLSHSIIERPCNKGSAGVYGLKKKKVPGVFKKKSPASPFTTPGTEDLKDLNQLTDIYQKAVGNKAPDKPYPRVETEEKQTTRVVRGNGL